MNSLVPILFAKNGYNNCLPLEGVTSPECAIITQKGSVVEITNQEFVWDERIKSGEDEKRIQERVWSEPGTREDLHA